MGVGLDSSGWRSIRVVCHLLGLVVLLGTDCFLWVALALGERRSHEEAGNIAESG